MHPNSHFRWEDREAMLAFASDVAFAHIFVTGPAGAAVVHAPLIVTQQGDLQFHVARGNRAVPMLDGATAIASIGGPGAYISPDWYEAADQVPTWNYVAVEAEGWLQRLEERELVAQLEALSRSHERRLAPKLEWTREKMTAGRFEAMLKAISGYRLHVESWRGTAKLSQNKSAEDVRGVVAGLRAAGRLHPADLVERANGHRL